MKLVKKIVVSLLLLSMQVLASDFKHPNIVETDLGDLNIDHKKKEVYIEYASNLFFVLERVNKYSLKFWRIIFWNRYFASQSKFINVDKNLEKFEEMLEKYKCGFLPGSRSLGRKIEKLEKEYSDDDFSKLKDLNYRIFIGLNSKDPRDRSKSIINQNNSFCWVAYVANRLDPKFEDIEMTVTILTDNGAPFQLHMGIFRNTLFTGIKTPRLSIRLHAFAAKALQKLGMNNVYLITSPLTKMGEILEEHLGDGTFFTYDRNYEPINPEK